MNQSKTLSFFVVLLSVIAITSCKSNKKTIKLMEPVKFSEVTIRDDFWSPILEKHKNNTIPVCIDQIENQTGRMRNFENAANGTGTHSGIFFDDSDVYKALEGMAYSLQNHPDPELEAKCDEWIGKFAAAQQPDGYLNTYYTLTGLENRWTNMDYHEMYCCGHMIEAAVAYYNVTGKRQLLDISEKMVAHMMDTFGPGKRDWVPGHEEIELALVKLYQTTGKEEYLHFADWLLSERGKGIEVTPEYPATHFQNVVPVRDLDSICGHAVRAMYLFCGMADVAAYTHDQGYIDAINRLWEDVVMRNMYITGGIGQTATNEGFSEDYSLPNKTAYCETCASVGMVLWNWRMNQFTGDAKYVDVMEKCLYNGVLAGISLNCDKFFYVNPLESDGDHHRQAWYGCACCPSQICRFLPSIGNYIYSMSKDALYVNIFIGNESDIMDITTNYPWEGNIVMTVKKEAAKKKEIRIRVPEWPEDGYAILINEKPANFRIENGYAVIDRRLKVGDQIALYLSMEEKIVAADPRVKEDEGLRALMRGPFVYCLEEVDNPEIDKAVLESKEIFDTVWSDKLGGIKEINTADGEHFIPYYTWDNREAGKMKVWIPYKE